MLVSVILPTLNRPQQAKNCVRRLFETTRGLDIECIVEIDGGDCVTLDALEPIESENPRLKIIWNEVHHGPVYLWNDGLRHASESSGAFVLAGDDLIWSDNWLTEALKALETLPNQDGMVGLNDKSLDGKIFASHYLVTRKFLINEMGGVMGAPCYEHYYLDVEAGAVAQRAKKYVWCGTAIAEHMHYSYQKSPKDETYALGLAHDESDRKIWRARVEAGYPHDYAPVLTE